MSSLLSEKMSRERSIKRFGEKLHTLRILRGLTLKELAHQLGHVAHGYISELEAGKKLPSVELTLSVARLFGISTDELLKDELELTVDTAIPTLETDNIRLSNEANNSK
ncbi:MAG: helix-turn-helix domain-containing protein [Ktedonobacteraceae bacterium]